MPIKIPNQLPATSVLTSENIFVMTETRAITHKVMVPPDMEGFVLSVAEDGDYTIEEPLVTIQKKDGSEAILSMTQKWPIRVPDP